jgi:ribonuclease-3
MGHRTLDTLERTLKHPFHNRALLEQAVTHSSLAFEQGGKNGKTPADNEKLEFLGDAVLGLVVAQSLYESFPGLEEGDLTRLRAALVSRRHLGSVAESLRLGDYLRLGRGEERNGGRTKAVLLANSFEAIVAALYLDAGIDVARAFVRRTVIDPTVQRLYKGLERGESMGDHKSALQELLQARGAVPPEYEVKAETGPDHRKRFLVEVIIPGSENLPSVTAQGTGTTKKKAEQEAARIACMQLQEQTSGSVAAPETHSGRKAPAQLQERPEAAPEADELLSSRRKTPKHLREDPISPGASKGVSA